MLQCGSLNAAHLPICIALLCTCTFAATYIMAVVRDGVDPLFPYISDTANGRPESCIFSMSLNAVAFLTAIVMYLRYRLVYELSQDSDWLLSRLNLAAMLCGALSCCGLVVLANFQASAVFIVHMSGALTCFGAGVCYCALQAALTRRMYPLYTGYAIWLDRVTRIVLSLLLAGLLAGGITCALLARYEFQSAYPGVPVPRPWSGADADKKGYWLHVASAICEWLLAALNTAFLLSYSRDFEKLRCTIQVQPLVAHLDNSPVEFDGGNQALL